MIISKGFAGQCDYPDDRARDGSRCGDRAASVRPGGRNPDTDWLIWVVLAGVGIFAGIKVMGSMANHPPFSNKKSINTNQTVFKVPKKQSYTNLDHSVSLRAENRPAINQTLANKASTEHVIIRDFGYVLEPLTIPIFEGVVEEAARQGLNEYDAAIVFMFAQMFSLSPGSVSSKNFVDLHTHNLLRLLSKSTDPRSNYVATINEIRSNHNLPALVV